MGGPGQQWDLSGTSLGLIRPRTIKRFYVKRKQESERKEWEEKREQAINVRDLFVDTESRTRDLMFMPITYRVAFECESVDCKGHDMSILDWEIYVLSRKLFAQSGDEVAQRKVIEKLNEYADPDARDCYFFLGNTQAHPGTFMVVGLYYPPRIAAKAQDKQMPLFGGL